MFLGVMKLLMLDHGLGKLDLGIQRTREFVAHRRATRGDLGASNHLWTDDQRSFRLGQRLLEEGQSISQVAKVLGLSKGSTHRLLQEVG